MTWRVTFTVACKNTVTNAAARMMMVWNQFMRCGPGRNSPGESAEWVAQRFPRDGRSPERCSWQFHEYFFERVHVHSQPDPRFVVKSVAHRMGINDLADQKPGRKNSAQPACDHALSGFDHAVSRQITQVHHRVVDLTGI